VRPCSIRWPPSAPSGAGAARLATPRAPRNAAPRRSYAGPCIGVGISFGSARARSRRRSVAERARTSLATSTIAAPAVIGARRDSCPALRSLAFHLASRRAGCSGLMPSRRLSRPSTDLAAGRFGRGHASRCPPRRGRRRHGELLKYPTTRAARRVKVVRTPLVLLLCCIVSCHPLGALECRKK
jgi:hypothetical protein